MREAEKQEIKAFASRRDETSAWEEQWSLTKKSAIEQHKREEKSLMESLVLERQKVKEDLNKEIIHDIENREDWVRQFEDEKTRLQRELDALRSSLSEAQGKHDLESAGYYEKQFNYETTEAYSDRLKEIWTMQKK